MHRRTLVAATGTVLSGGCLTVFEEGEEIVETTHIDERLTESESFFFEVAAGAETEIIVRLEESGSVTVDLSPQDGSEQMLDESLETTDPPLEETYSPALDGETTYVLAVGITETTARVTVRSVE